MNFKSIWNTLFRRKTSSPHIGHDDVTAVAPKINTVAIPIPEGYPPELLVRVPLHQPRAPDRKGKRRTAEELEADYKAWVQGSLHQARVRFDFDRVRAKGAGATHYRWRTMDGYGCSKCRERNGKLIAINTDHDFQHPGCMMCISDYNYGDDEENNERVAEPCRCTYEFVFPD